MMYCQDDLKELASKINLVEYISQTEELHRKGQNYFIKCPFHYGDDTPSLCIYPDSQTWHCFGCCKGGNIFTWIVHKEDVSFTQAVESVQKIVGVDLTNKVQSPTMQYLKSLKTEEKVEIVRQPLDWKRDYFDIYDDELPEEWLQEDMTPDALRKYNIRIDKAHNRIVYPVLDKDGVFIGVKGRTRIKGYKELGIQKYMNYNKIGTIDYFQGFQQAEFNNTKSVIIFEGIKSCIKSYGWGIKNIMALETANMSEGQLQLLIKNGFAEVIFGLDSDQLYQDIIKNSRVQTLKRFTKVSIITDRNHLLDNKMAPVDKGEQVFRELLEERIRL